MGTWGWGSDPVGLPVIIPSTHWAVFNHYYDEYEEKKNGITRGERKGKETCEEGNKKKNEKGEEEERGERKREKETIL